MADINEGYREYLSTDNAILIDVRSMGEYMAGHLPGSICIPLQSFNGIDKRLSDRQQPIFFYCRSGARSEMAANLLKNMGYANATNIGGIVYYTGTLEF